ncbi:10555_t:CDS:2 [Ambispora leptoticha]|uniref:10555_t:CDS:1 n=1 Tax=Ambispora leptoticha TaxID=144679 RepID=A0A9N9G5T1_9GLOM|nr:10555_t:CDS:2 [Ambispora leptoticha]
MDPTNNLNNVGGHLPEQIYNQQQQPPLAFSDHHGHQASSGSGMGTPVASVPSTPQLQYQQTPQFQQMGGYQIQMGPPSGPPPPDSTSPLGPPPGPPPPDFGENKFYQPHMPPPDQGNPHPVTIIVPPPDEKDEEDNHQTLQHVSLLSQPFFFNGQPTYKTYYLMWLLVCPSVSLNIKRNMTTFTLWFAMLSISMTPWITTHTAVDCIDILSDLDYRLCNLMKSRVKDYYFQVVKLNSVQSNDAYSYSPEFPFNDILKF